MAKPLIDGTAGEQDWWNPEESKYLLDLLLEKTDEEIRTIYSKVIGIESSVPNRYYMAVRIRTKLHDSVDFADALDVVQEGGE